MMVKGAYANITDRSIDKEFFQHYAEMPSEWGLIAPSTSQNSGTSYIVSEMAGLGTLRVKPESEPMTIDSLVTGNKMTVLFTAYALAAQLSREMLSDDVHGNVSKALSRLARNAQKTQDIEFMKFMANSFGTSLAWDGNPICYDTHATLRGGTTIDNLGTAALSPTSFQAALDYFANMVGADDLPVMRVPKKLLYARENSQIAWELQKSINRVLEYSSTTGRDKGLVHDTSTYYTPGAQNDTNRFNPTNDYMAAWSGVENHYYTAAGADQSDWWLFSDDPGQAGIQFRWRDKVETGQFFDELSQSKIFTSYMRFAIALPDFTTVYGGNLA